MKANYNSIAEEYENTRPNYPAKLFEKLLTNTRINGLSNLLEIGAGTGKATMPLAQKGFNIDCIEIEPRMAEILEDKSYIYPKVNVIVNSFESWNNDRKKYYDLIYSAQAFHWIDEKTKYKKCYELLNSYGQIALFWYLSVFDRDEILHTINSIFSDYDTGYSYESLKDIESFLERERDKLSESEYFKDIKSITLEPTKISQTAKEFVNRFNTTSAYASLCNESQQKINKDLFNAVEKMGGSISTEIHYIMLIADRV